VACAALRLLQDALDSQRLDLRGHLLALMPYCNYDFARPERSAGSNDVLHQRPSAGSMQNLRQTGLQPRAFSRSEDNDSQIIRRHKPNHSAGAESISQMHCLARDSRGVLVGCSNGRKSRQRSLRWVFKRFASRDRPKRGISQQPADELCVQGMTSLVRFHVAQQRQPC
jgi:hypothetical protein